MGNRRGKNRVGPSRHLRAHAKEGIAYGQARGERRDRHRRIHGNRALHPKHLAESARRGRELRFHAGRWPIVWSARSRVRRAGRWLAPGRLAKARCESSALSRRKTAFRAAGHCGQQRRRVRFMPPRQGHRQAHFHRKFDLMSWTDPGARRAVKHFGAEGGSILNTQLWPAPPRRPMPRCTAPPRPPLMP